MQKGRSLCIQRTTLQTKYGPTESNWRGLPVIYFAFTS
jgi:hypothetical protein